MTDNATPGFYGKFPELGDFVNRRMLRSFIDPWDEWLQNSIATSRQQLEDNWLQLYLTSPIWRFTLSAGLCGPQSWAGLLMPSVDRVGRYFPLMIATALPEGANLFQVSAEAQEWFDAAENVILSALDDEGFNLDDFDRKVEELGGDLLPAAEMSVFPSKSGYGSAWRIPLDEESNLSPVLPGLMNQLVLLRLGEYSLWWSSGSEKVKPSMLICSGMPPAQDFSTMLSGQWQQSSWDDWQPWTQEDDSRELDKEVQP